jgi:hypothetical protein
MKGRCVCGSSTSITRLGALDLRSKYRIRMMVSAYTVLGRMVKWR